MSRSGDRTPLAQTLIAIRGELTQDAAAAKAGVTREQWVKWENGGGIGRTNADKITAAFELEDGLLEPYINERATSALDPALRSQLVEAVHQFAQVGPQLVAVARQLSEALAANEESQAQTRGLVADLLAALRAAEEDRKRRQSD